MSEEINNKKEKVDNYSTKSSDCKWCMYGWMDG